MSIQPINSSESTPNIASKMSGATLIGAVVGGGYTAKDKNWLYKGSPSDFFVKSISTGLRKTMNSDELVEGAKIYRFVEKAVNPVVDLETLKPLIIDSKELSDAIKSTPDETVENAISRVFAQPDKSKVRQDLISLQYKTVSNEKFGKNAALKLIYKNFDPKGKKLVKDISTSEKMFTMLKKTAMKVQTKAVATGTALGALAGAAFALIVSDVPEKKA